jgi:hypothetical protein
MEWQMIVALVVVVPIVLMPLAFIWYLSIGGIYAAIREAQRARAARTATPAEVKIKV